MAESVKNWRARVLQSKYAIGLTEVEFVELQHYLIDRRHISSNSRKSLLEKLNESYKLVEDDYSLEGKSLLDP